MLDLKELEILMRIYMCERGACAYTQIVVEKAELEGKISWSRFPNRLICDHVYCQDQKLLAKARLGIFSHKYQGSSS